MNDVLASKTAPPLFYVSHGGPESDFDGSYTAKLNNDRTSVFSFYAHLRTITLAQS